MNLSAQNDADNARIQRADRRFRRRWFCLALVSLAIIVALIAPASAHWTCADALQYRTEIQNLTAEQRKHWIKVLRLTKRQVRQARACLRGG
jgi:hypothetical protein